MKSFKSKYNSASYIWTNNYSIYIENRGFIMHNPDGCYKTLINQCLQHPPKSTVAPLGLASKQYPFRIFLWARTCYTPKNFPYAYVFGSVGDLNFSYGVSLFIHSLCFMVNRTHRGATVSTFSCEDCKKY